MVMSPVERLMARRQVNAEIDTDPVEITPRRREKVNDGAGGWTWGPETDQDPITVLIAPAKRRLSDILINTEMGDVIEYPYILVAHHDDDIRRGDFFTWNGDEFEVKSVHIKTEVSKVAQVDYYGGGTTNG